MGTTTGSAAARNDAVLWKRSQPNVLIFRPTGSVTQVIDNIDTSKTYRIVFYYVKFDTPTANACTLTTTIGTQTILTEVNAAPRTPNNTFDQKITASFQPTDSSMPLTIGVI